MNGTIHRTGIIGRLLAILAAYVSLVALDVGAETSPAKGIIDSRVRVASYRDGEVYRLHGYVGYQIDLQFEPGETFVGLGTGDIEGLSFAAQDNHLFLKPKAATVGTNLTVLTSRRPYQFDYTASVRRPVSGTPDLVYALQFVYPPSLSGKNIPAAAGPDMANRIDAQLDHSAGHRARNIDYWYRGHPALKPLAASDDGVHTRLRFGPRSELPAIFVRNEDGGESLLNFSMDLGDVIVHRVARGFVVRRGSLTGCIVNKGFIGAGERLESGTVAPGVERITTGAHP